MKNRFSSALAAASRATLLATTLAACLNGTAWAQTATPQTVEVSARAAQVPRTDVSTLCPGIHEELAERLAAAAREIRTAGTVTVRMDIDGPRVHALRAQGSVPAHNHAVRRAMFGLACSNGAAGRQAAVFQVRFVDPYAAGTDQRVAIVEGAGALR